jgi:hypothetical protein
VARHTGAAQDCEYEVAWASGSSPPRSPGTCPTWRRASPSCST